MTDPASAMTEAPTTPLAALYASLPTLPNGQHPEAILAALDKQGWTLVRKGEPSEAQVGAVARAIPKTPSPEMIKAIEFAIYRYSDCSARDAERGAPHVYNAILALSATVPAEPGAVLSATDAAPRPKRSNSAGSRTGWRRRSVDTTQSKGT